MTKRFTALFLAIAASLALAACETIPKNNADASLTQPPALQQQQQGKASVGNAASPSNATRVDFRLAQTEKGDGLSELPFSDGSLWYAPEPVLTRADLRSVEPRKTAEGRPYVRFSFTPQGAQKLATVSQRLPNKLLVLSLDNSLQAVYEMDRPINSGVLDIGVSSEKQALDIAKKIAE